MILYKKRRKYKYTLFTDYIYETGIENSFHHKSNYLELTREGRLTIRKGYCWDGPSGPTIDTKTFMQGALVHDALYQLMREKVLPQECRRKADELLRDICKKDGMAPFRAAYVFRCVRIFCKSFAKPDLIEAPKPTKEE